MSAVCAVNSPEMWSPSPDLSPRVRRLREEYFSFMEREYFRNEVMSFSTGRPWDVVYSEHTWCIVPEVIPFLAAFKASLLVDAAVVPLPDAFWKESREVRRALFLRENNFYEKTGRATGREWSVAPHDLSG